MREVNGLERVAPLLGRGDLAVFLQCGKRKRAGTHPALSLYTGTYFQLSLALARLLIPDQSIHVLSAKHGVLRHDNRVRNYDLSLRDMDAEELAEWRERVRGEVAEAARGRTAVFICGGLYHGGLEGVKLIPPSLGIGDQQRWLKQAVIRYGRRGFFP